MLQSILQSMPFEIPAPAPLPSEPLEWSNTEQTTHLWQLANNGDIQSLAAWSVGLRRDGCMCWAACRLLLTRLLTLPHSLSSGRVYREPTIVHLRSEDGRGALFWASEYEKYEMIDFLLERGADPQATDATGNKPEGQLLEGHSSRVNGPTRELAWARDVTVLDR